MKKDRSWLLLAPMYAFTLVFVLGPVIYMAAVSLAHHTAAGFTWQLSLENFRKMADPVYLQCFRQSLLLAFLTTVICVGVGYPFGYIMARLSPRGKRAMMLLIMIPFWTSSLIRLYGWQILLQARGPLNGALLALGIVSKPVKILYTYPAVLIGMVYALLPFMQLAVYNSVEKLDWTLVEAARDLGAGPVRAFLTVTLKLTLPGLMSGVILTFVPSMGLFFISDLLGGNKIVLVGSLIQDQLTRGSNWPFAAALALVLAVITTLLLALYRRITHTAELEVMF